MSKQFSTKQQKKEAILFVAGKVTDVLLESVDIGADRDEEEELMVIDMFHAALNAFEKTLRVQKALQDAKDEFTNTDSSEDPAYVTFPEDKKKEYN
jgi:ethanolamine utilization protein EutA (predicted chaperonin)